MTVLLSDNIVVDKVANIYRKQLFSILLMDIMLVFVGMWMETIAQIFILGPVFLPVMEAVGVDPYTYGIIFVMGCEIGFETPPLGANIFVTTELGEHSYEQVSAYALRFAFAEIIALVLVSLIPQISLFLPNLFMGII